MPDDPGSEYCGSSPTRTGKKGERHVQLRKLTTIPLIEFPGEIDKIGERPDDPVLALKIIPPRPRKNVLTRTRLDSRIMRSADVSAAIVEAPTGYGKTLLLAQWRRAAMLEGAAGAWLRLDECDNDGRMLYGIAMAMRQATGRTGFAAHIARIHGDSKLALDAAAGLLAEWSQLAHPVILVLDEFDRLTDPSAPTVARYLIANIPPNGRIFVGARAIEDRPWLLELQATGDFLAEISILELLNPQICGEVARRSDADKLIAELRKSTPLILDREDGRFELHQVGADYLREQAAALPLRHRRRLHMRAASWLRRHEYWEEATKHAFEAGDDVTALDCIDKCVDTLVASGKFELLDKWFKRLPLRDVYARPRRRV